MTQLLSHLHLPRAPRIPRQARVSATCISVGCCRRGTDIEPARGTCPACEQPLTETRTVTR
jgi:hypothetical protein